VARMTAAVVGIVLLALGLGGCGTAGDSRALAPSMAARPQLDLTAARSSDLLALSRDDGSCHLLLNSGATVTASTAAVNGTSTSAVCVDAGARLVAAVISVQGGLLRHGGTVSAAVRLQQPGARDWMTALRPPKAPAAACPGAACPDGASLTGRQTYRLLPGTYQQTVNVSSKARVCVAPGSYALRASWNLDGPLHPYGSAGCPALPSPASDPGVLLFFARGHLQLNSGGSITLVRAMRRGRYQGLLYWQADGQATALDGARFSGGGWYEPRGALILNSGARLTAPFLVAATIIVNSDARLSVAAPPTP
jgi:hypothetical protein